MSVDQFRAWGFLSGFFVDWIKLSGLNLLLHSSDIGFLLGVKKKNRGFFLSGERYFLSIKEPFFFFFSVLFIILFLIPLEFQLYVPHFSVRPLFTCYFTKLM